MTKPSEPLGYDRLYKEFESPLMKTLRAAAYARDIGQHSWASAEELETAIAQLRLSRSSNLLDLGCGPGGPLTFLAKQTGCEGSGIDLSTPAIDAARERAGLLGLQARVHFQQGDLDEDLPFAPRTFDAAMSLDVIPHLRNRERTFREVARVLARTGRFFFTDAGVVTGAITDEEKRLRASTAPIQFVTENFNERALEQAGFRLIERYDSTQNVLTVATGRLSARTAHAAEFKEQEGVEGFTRQQIYLEKVAMLSERRALSRISYLAEALH